MMTPVYATRNPLLMARYAIDRTDNANPDGTPVCPFDKRRRYCHEVYYEVSCRTVERVVLSMAQS